MRFFSFYDREVYLMSQGQHPVQFPIVASIVAKYVVGRNRRVNGESFKIVDELIGRVQNNIFIVRAEIVCKRTVQPAVSMGCIYNQSSSVVLRVLPRFSQLREGVGKSAGGDAKEKLFFTHRQCPS